MTNRPNSPSSGRLARIGRWLAVLLLAGYAVFAVVLLTLRFAVLPHIDEHRGSIERWIGQAIDRPVHIARIGADWAGLRPRLEIRGVEIGAAPGAGAESVPLRIPGIEAVIAWRSVLVGSLRLHSARIEGVDLEVRRDADGHLWVGGFETGRDDDGDHAGAFGWLLRQDDVELDRARLRWIDERHAGAAPLQLDEVRVRLRNAPLRHRLALRATPPAAIAAPIDLRVEFDGSPFSGDALDWSHGHAIGYLEAPRLDMGALREAVGPLAARLPDGSVALRGWLDLLDGDLSGVTADVAVAGVGTRVPGYERFGELRHAGLRLVATRERHGAAHVDRIAVEHLQLATTAGLELPASDFMQTLEYGNDGALVGGETRAPALELAPLVRIARQLPLPEALATRLVRFDPRGRLDDLRYRWRGDWNDPSTYRLAARFAGLSIASEASSAPTLPEHPWNPGEPGFTNLSGQIEVVDGRGRLSLDSAGASFSYPGVFEAPRIDLDELRLDATWVRDADGLAIEVSRADWSNLDGGGHVEGRWYSPWKPGARFPGTLELDGHLDRIDAASVQRYLPLSIPDSVRHWARDSIAGGRYEGVDVKVRGDLRHFPFGRERDGEFSMTGRLRDGRLEVAAGRPGPNGSPREWPLIEAIDGQLAFERSGFWLSDASGRTANVALEHTRVGTADYSKPEHALEIDGQARGGIAGLLGYVEASPVSQWVGGALHEADGAGGARLGLSLKLVLNDLPGTTVRGRLDFDGARLALGFVPPLDDLAGHMSFDQHGVREIAADAHFMGGPLHLSSPGDAPGAQFAVHAEGRADVDPLRDYLNFPVLEPLSGSAAYAGDITVRDGRPAVHLRSSLVGIASELPPPMRKGADAALPFDLAMTTDALPEHAGAREHWTVAIGEQVRLLFERERREGEAPRIVRAAFGAGAPATLPAEGSLGLVDLPELDLDAWRRMVMPDPRRTTARGSPATTAGLPLPLVFAGSAGSVKAGGRRIEHVVGGATLESAGTVSVNVVAPDVEGTVNWTPPTHELPGGRVTARLFRLVVPAVPEGGGGQAAGDGVDDLLDASGRTELPAFDVVVESLSLHGKDFGRVEVQGRAEALSTSADGVREWQIKHLTLATPEAKLDATGSFARSFTRLDFKLDVTDLGRFLERMGVPGAIKDGTLALAGKAQWRGSPIAIDVPSLDGDMTMTVGRGQFLHTDPGVGRLIGVLSLQSLPRRVTLDFRDVFSEGFAFDRVHATLQLRRGIASTTDFTMSGVAATVLLDGQADLAAETQDLHVHVLPEINAGGASVVYALVANPIIGLGTFLAQWALRAPLTQAFSSEYRITGPWTNPQVDRVDGRAAPAPAAPAAPAPGPAPGSRP